MPAKFPYGIDPGDLPHMITLQKPNHVERRDEVGATIADFVDVETVHAKVSPLSGREEFLAAQMQATTTHSVTVRWSPKNNLADGSWRIKFGTRLLLLDG